MSMTESTSTGISKQKVSVLLVDDQQIVAAAVRMIVEILEPYDSKDRERILSWAGEKLAIAEASLKCHSH